MHIYIYSKAMNQLQLVGILEQLCGYIASYIATWLYVICKLLIYSYTVHDTIVVHMIVGSNSVYSYSYYIAIVTSYSQLLCRHIYIAIRSYIRVYNFNDMVRYQKQLQQLSSAPGRFIAWVCVHAAQWLINPTLAIDGTPIPSLLNLLCR